MGVVKITPPNIKVLQFKYSAVCGHTLIVISTWAIIAINLSKSLLWIFENSLIRSLFKAPKTLILALYLAICFLVNFQLNLDAQNWKSQPFTDTEAIYLSDRALRSYLTDEKLLLIVLINCSEGLLPISCNRLIIIIPANPTNQGASIRAKTF